MSLVKINCVRLENNPAQFDSPITFTIEFECLADLDEDLEWKMIYVGSASDSKYDQVLDSIVVGPLQTGSMEFEFEADAPDVMKIPENDIVGVTVLLLTCSYKGQEFIRIGYYVNNEYVDLTAGVEEDRPASSQYERLPLKERAHYIMRNILVEEPRITRFAIDWDSNNGA